MPVFVAAVAILFCFLSVRVPALTVTENRTGHVVYRKPVEARTTFSLSYVHSIHRTPVEETFTIDDGWRIVLVSISFSSLGVGMPAHLEEGERFQFRGDRMVIEGMNRVLGSIDLFIGQAFPENRLRNGDDDIRLATVSRPGASVRIAVEPCPILTLMMKGAEPRV